MGTPLRARRLLIVLAIAASIAGACSAPDGATPATADGSANAPSSSATTPPPATLPSLTPSSLTPPSLTRSSLTRSSAGSRTVSSAAISPTSITPPHPTTSDGLPRLESVGMAGVNDISCRSTRPPVVLLHGTVSTPARNFTPLAGRLQADGRCVYAVLYGQILGWGGLGPVDDSATQVTAFVRAVLASTHTKSVDVVAFSQGALVLRDALATELAPTSVRLAVLIAPNYHGTTIDLVDLVPSGLCPSCQDQAAGSALLKRLDAVGELAPGVRYASLSSRNDAWVVPAENQAPRGPADRVRAAILEDTCPDARVEHGSMPGEPAVINWVMAALATDGRPPAEFACS